VSIQVSLKDREVEALERELRSSGDPDIAAVVAKLGRRSEPEPIPGQFSIEDYPEVYGARR
jgi:hypothetical protein